MVTKEELRAENERMSADRAATWRSAILGIGPGPVANYVDSVRTHLGAWVGEDLERFFSELRDAFGCACSWTILPNGALNVNIGGPVSPRFAHEVRNVLAERMPVGMAITVSYVSSDEEREPPRKPPAEDAFTTMKRDAECARAAAMVPTADLSKAVASVYAHSEVYPATRSLDRVTAAPRSGQRWRSPTGEEGRIYDCTHENSADVWHLRMASGLRVREEHADLVTAWTYVDGPTEPETARERFDRVGALMVADRPDGVTDRTWQAVVMAMGEGEDDAGLQAKCAAARVALAVAERMRVMR